MPGKGNKQMKKNDLFIDVSSHNGYDITGILADMGTQNTIRLPAKQNMIQ